MENEITKHIIPHANAIITMIKQARQRALTSVNIELIQLYWKVGEYLDNESSKSSWGDAFIDTTANYIQENYPEVKGFNRRGLYRMKRFYETYKNHSHEFVTTVLSQISWSHHLAILTAAKTDEEREFYIHLCIKEKYSTRELQQQLDSGYFYRYMLSEKALVAQRKDTYFLDSYVLEFLKPHENLSIGVILCTSKEDAIVEYSMSRSLSPTMVSEYTLKLIDKKLLEQKLLEFKGLMPEE